MRATIRNILFETKPVIPLVLDTLSVSSAAAYSLRLLRTAYTGFCIRVRRSSDNTEQNIGFASGVLDTATLLAFVGVGNGFIVTWYDQSGNALNATQATAASQPRIVTAGVLDVRNTKATSIYSTAQRLQTSAAFNHPAQLSACAVAFSNVNTDSAVFQVGAVNTVGSLFAESNEWRARATGLGAVTPYAGSQLEQLSGSHQNGLQSIYRRGVKGTDATQTLASATNVVLTIGELAGFYSLNGGISELVLFSSVLSTADRQLLENNQISYYGTP